MISEPRRLASAEGRGSSIGDQREVYQLRGSGVAHLLLRRHLVRVPELAFCQDCGQGLLLLLKIPVPHCLRGVPEGEQVLQHRVRLQLGLLHICGVQIRYS